MTMKCEHWWCVLSICVHCETDEQVKVFLTRTTSDKKCIRMLPMTL